MKFKVGDRIKHRTNPSHHIVGDVVYTTGRHYIVHPIEYTSNLTLDIKWMDNNYTLVESHIIDKVLNKYLNE